MREVRHVVARIIGKTCIQFYQGISDNEEFCLDRERQREDEQLLVGEQHPKASKMAYTAPEAPTVVIMFRYSLIGMIPVPMFTLVYCDSSVTYCMYCTPS